jgi:anti-sigma factor RsiW
MSDPNPRSDLDAYLDGELAPEERAAFEHELERSSDLRRALQLRRELEDSLQALPRAEPSPQFEARFWARLARAEKPQGGRAAFLPLRGWGPILAGPALAAAVLFLLLGNPSLPQSDWELLADGEGFELVLSEDPELLAALELLEAWDGTEAL